MNKEMSKIEFLPSYEEFKDKILNNSESKDVLDKVADLYDKVPAYFKILTNFDLTGISGSIDQVLTENKQKREQENILKAMYGIAVAVAQINLRQIEFDHKYLSEQGPPITYVYFDKCKETYDSNKIEYFRNIWFNGFIDIVRDMDEKIYIFDIVSSLTREQILVLKIMFERNLSYVVDIAKEINVTSDRAQQICISLQGRGLVYDSSIGMYDYPGPVYFEETDFVRLLVKYITVDF